MESMNIINIHVWRERERFTQTADHYFLGFTISGLVFHKGEDFSVERPGPLMHLSFPGEKFTFEYDDRRENWGIMFFTDRLRTSDDKKTALMRHQGDWVPFPRLVFIEPEQVEGLREEYMRLREAFNDPTPGNSLYVKLGLFNLLRGMLDRESGRLARSPVDQFRSLISDLTNAHRGLEDLSAECGYSVEYMRMLFKQEYGISPQTYRIRHRMAQAMNLVANSNLSLKEIAYRTGFKHPSHFSTLFRKTYGLSARDAMKQHRYGVMEADG